MERRRAILCAWNHVDLPIPFSEAHVDGYQ